MFKYNLSDKDYYCYSDYNNLDCYIELYKDYAYYNILLGGAAYRSGYMDYEDVERKIPPVQFLNNEIDEKFRTKFIEVVNRALEEKKKEKIAKNKKVENIENSKILSVAYSSILSVKTLCFEKDGKKSLCEYKGFKY